MDPFDPALASPLRIEWLAGTDPVMEDDLGRAISEKAEHLLRAVRFIEESQSSGIVDMEIRVWVEGASGPACVSVTWEPGLRAFGFHLLDESLQERLACVVFADLPCVDADASNGQLEAIFMALGPADRSHVAQTVRIPVVEHRSVDSGVER